MLRILRHIVFTILLLGYLLTQTGTIATAQSYIEIFGQNREQFRKFDWKFFDTKHFRVYHYDKSGRQLGRYVAEEADNSISVVEKKLGGRFPPRFNIILYNSYEEYRQTNVGLKDESPLTGNVRAGTVNLVGDKLVVYFTGAHEDLRHQIRTGMANVVMERMIFGESFRKMVKNALTLNLPEWVTTGYIAYLVDGWDAKSNSAWKGIIDAQPKETFYRLSEMYPELAGKAFWRFVSEQYGMNMVKELLATMQQKTKLNKAFKDPAYLGMKITKAYDSCMKFYKGVYRLDALKQELPDSANGLIALKVPKDNSIVRSIRVSPRGSDVAYVVWKEGKYTVFTQKTAGEQVSSILLEGGQKDLTEQTDPDYPMLAWSTTGYKLAILYKKGFDTKLRIYNSLKGQIENYDIPKNRFDRVLSMCFMQDDDKLVFSAIKKSQTDLHMFTIKGSKLTNITDDVWDDVAPVFVSGGSRVGILFLSNRPKPNMNVPLGVNEMPTGPMKVFFYNTKTMSTELMQCSNYTTGNVTQPIQYGFDNFAYLYDGNGVNNRYVVLFARDKKNRDSAYAVPTTNYTSSIISQQYNLASGDVADVVQMKDKYMVYFHELVMPGPTAPAKVLTPTILSVDKAERKKTEQAKTQDQIGQPVAAPDEKKQPEIKTGNAFQSEFADTDEQPKHKAKSKENIIFNANKENTTTDSSVLSVITDSAYLKMKPANYRLSFKPDFFSIKLDNSILFTQYQSIASNGGQYQNPSLGGLINISLNDVLENYRISAGFQLPIDMAASTYYLQYQNFKKRMDWGLMILRSADKQTLPVGYMDQNGNLLFVQEQQFKSVLTMLQADISYPLDRIRSVRFHTSVRQDKLTERATDTLSLTYEVPNTVNYTSMSRLEYVFDNTISPVLNIMHGTRYKFYAEYIYGLNNGNKGCYNFGLDVRSYKKLYRNVILANRLAYAHSDGTAEVEYLLGGVDNWIKPEQSSNASQGPTENYGYQAMCVPMRGYLQYGRTGNNFAVLNTEVRAPIFSTFIKRPVQSAILTNLQAVAFVDAGGAWAGFLPDASNMDNTYKFPSIRSPYPGSNNNVFLNLTVPNSGGLALGYGAGLRTSLLGYFVRLDAAWNIEGNKKPIVYFALGTDF